MGLGGGSREAPGLLCSGVHADRWLVCSVPGSAAQRILQNRSNMFHYLTFRICRHLGERGLVWFNMQQSSLTPDRQNNPAELPEIAVSPGAKQSLEIHHESKRQRKKEKGDLPSASSILIFFCFLFSPGSAESGPLALTEKSFGVDLSSPCRCNNNNALC